MEERFSFAVALPAGEVSVSAIWQGAAGSDVVVLAHGAGAGMDHAFLTGLVAPQLFIEGTNDPFIQPIEQFEQVLADCPSARVVWVEGGGHSFEVKGQRRTASEIGASLAPAIVEFTHL